MDSSAFHTLSAVGPLASDCVSLLAAAALRRLSDKLASETQPMAARVLRLRHRATAIRPRPLILAVGFWVQIP